MNTITNSLIPPMKLTTAFYNNHAVDVASNLLGKKLVYGKFTGIITETEAYRGRDDEASHAYPGITKRSAIMFGPPGYSYIYLIYGMYYCFNIVTEEAGEPSAVLIRGLKLPDIHLDGPGKICRHLGLSKQENGINLITSKHLYVTEGIPIIKKSITPRIGIRKAVDKPWRFVADISQFSQHSL